MEVTWKDLSMEEFFMGKRIFHEGGDGFPSIIEKNDQKLN